VLQKQLSARTLGCGNDLVEALITAQRIPARIEAEIASMMDRPDLGDDLESPGRDAPCTPAPHFP